MLSANLFIFPEKPVIFVTPPHNRILVLRGNNQPEEWISLEYYQKNKEKYYVKIGDTNNPDVLGLLSNV